MNLDVFPVPLIFYDLDWKIIRLNTAAHSVLGYESENALINQPINLLFCENEYAVLYEVQNSLLGAQGDKIKRNVCLRSSNGKLVKMCSQFNRYFDENMTPPEGYMQTCMELQESPECTKTTIGSKNYSLLAENIPGLEVFLVDRELNVLSRIGNETFFQGWNRNLSGIYFPDYLPEEIAQSLKPMLKLAFESTPLSHEFEENENYFSIRIIPVVEKKKVQQCVIVLQNITETKMVENQLKLSKKESEEANRAKDDFVAKMSHEIRTPLNAISGFTEQLRKTPLTKVQQDYINVVSNSSRHLLTLIDEILILSKIELGQIDLEETAFKLVEITQAVHDMLEIKIKKKNLQFHTSVDGAADDYLLGDPARLRQILLNLVDNAIKFTHRGSISLKCILVSDNPGSKLIRFEVSDTGIGISDPDQEKIFQPFHQVDSSYERSFTGCGLGLTISRDLVNTMGGIMKVDSVPGQGSIFSFTLNLKTASAVAHKTESDLIRNINLQHINILFVDDDPVNRLLGEIILKKYDIRTDFAKSGLEALKLFQPGKYHLIFLDINMPDINGMEVTRYLRQIEKAKNASRKTHIVAMTANAVSKHVKQYLESGMDSVMLKPYDEDTIYRKIVAIAKRENGHDLSGLLPDKAIEDTPFDLDNLLRITRGDKEFTLLMLDTFIENSEKLLSKIKKSYHDKNFAHIAETAHRLAPSMEQLGVTRATRLLKEIENKYLDEMMISNEADPMVEQAIVEIKAGILAIRKATANIKQQYHE
jgi:signal transduction histidine kinase/DNA-binding response OmpR family regulator